MGGKLHKVVYDYDKIGKILGYFNTKFQFKLLSFYKDEKIVKLIKDIKNEVDFAFYPNEAFIVYSIVKSQTRIPGDMAEVGVYQGGSAKLICEVKGQNNLYLFDTFEGLPEVSDDDTHYGIKHWKTGEFSNTSLDAVEKYLANYSNVYFHKGIFPQSVSQMPEKKYSFVHLDVDLYQSTKDCLEYFFPRLSLGGIILTHDYQAKGIKKAYSEFFDDKKIPIIELSGTQCLIVKTFN